MKKFVIGVIVGIAITASATAYGEEIVDSIIGKKIDGSFPVKIEGKTLEKHAAVIEGTSYLPVRAIGDALNMEVKFDAEMGIELISKEDDPVAEGEVTAIPETVVPKEVKIELLEGEISKTKVFIHTTKSTLSNEEKNPIGRDVKKLKAELIQLEQELADLEAELAILQQ